MAEPASLRPAAAAAGLTAAPPLEDSIHTVPPAALSGVRRRRPLPAQWTHRTAHRVYSGPLHDRSAPADAPVAAGDRAASADPRASAALASSADEDLVAAPLARQHPLQVLWVLTRTDFRARYRSQALGILWSLLNPLVMMGLISIVFTHVFRSTEKFFPVFLLIGLVIWQWVTGAMNAVTGVFVANADIIKRTIFARQLLPISTILSYGLHFCMESLVIVLFIPIFPGAFRLTPALLLVPVFIGLLILLLSGAALAVSVLNVIYRDVAYMVTTLLLLLYWLTPVFYPMDVIPYPFRTWLQCNPIAGILTGLRRAIMHGEAPTLLGWAGIVVPTAVMLLVGWRIYRHYEHMVLDFV